MLVCLLVTSASALATTDTVLNDLRKMLDASQNESAYQLGRKQTAWQGNPHFDFLFGMAAIGSSHLPEGLLALERHLSVVPANDRARLELAKGYFELGEYARARQEFEFVLRYNPPQTVRANIQKYLDSMQTREVLATRASSRAWLELSLGRDSNVNAGTNDADTFNTQLGILPPPPNDPAWEHGSYFWQLSGSKQWLRRVDPKLTVFAGLDFDLKQNPSASEFDTGNLGGYLGFSALKGPGLYRLTLSDGQMWVDAERYRNTLSVTGETQYSLGKGYTATGVAQYSRLAHAQTNEIRDANLLTLGGGLQKAFQSAWRPTLGLQVTFGRESNLNLRKDLERDVWTARLTLAANPTERVSLNAGISRQGSQFEAADAAFGSIREDRMWTGDIGVNYLLTRNWLLRADVQYTDNDSNQGLYDYRRHVWGLRARYLF